MSEAVAPAELQPEDAARAAYYALIARLFYAAPDKSVLAQIVDARAIEGDSELARAWAELVSASRSAVPVLLGREHTDLFGGTARAESTPYLTHYTIKFAADTPLVEVRQQLARWGIARHDATHEPEDHIAGICEAMRFAIAVQHRPDDEQKAFFERFLYRGAVAFCDAVTASQKASFYRPVARFARAFLEIEREAFSML